MDEKCFESLPYQLGKRAQLYLNESRKLVTDEFPSFDAATNAQIVVQLAAALMNLEAAEVMASAQDDIATKIEEMR
jgi:homoserine kinase